MRKRDRKRERRRGLKKNAKIKILAKLDKHCFSGQRESMCTNLASVCVCVCRNCRAVWHAVSGSKICDRWGFARQTGCAWVCVYIQRYT